MKKIIILLFIFLMFQSCALIPGQMNQEKCKYRYGKWKKGSDADGNYYIQKVKCWRHDEIYFRKSYKQVP